MTETLLSPDPTDIAKDAHAWVRTLNSGRASAWDAQAFRRWRDADLRHRQAFQEAARQWRLLEAVGGELLAGNAQAARHHRETMQPRRAGRRAFLGTALGGAAAAGVAAYAPLGFWPDAEQWGADYRTAVGEQRELSLGRGVTLAMNTRTSLRRLDDGEPGVGLELLEGEAALDITRDAAAFLVQAGTGRMRAGDAHFELRKLDGRICVTCLRGEVVIEHAAGRRLLQARQLAVYDGRAISEIAAVDPEKLPAWRRGELVFKQTPLPEVVREINRYRPGRVVLASESRLRGETVTARIKVREIETALLQIQYSFDLTARAFPAGVLVLT